MPFHRHASAGFGLVELIVTVAIMAILLTLAVPALGRVLANSRTVAVANELQRSVALARTDALQTGNMVEIRPAGGGGWSGGWEVVRHALDPQGVAAEQVLMHSGVAMSKMDVVACEAPSPDASVEFGASGFPSGSIATRTFKIQPAAGETDIVRYVTIHPSGRAEVLAQAACS